jgi:hypothetical protein
MENSNLMMLDLRYTRDILTVKHVMSDSDCQSAKNVKRASETMNKPLRRWAENGAGAALSVQYVILVPPFGPGLADCSTAFFLYQSCERPFENPSFFQRGDQPFCERCFDIMLRNEV